MLTKNEITALNLSPTKKDFVQIWNELLEVAGKLSERWDPTSTNESDPGIVILKALTGIADKLNYNIDKNILEAFMPTAAQEDSMRKLCDMLGYNIKYYRSAETNVTIKYYNPEPSEKESEIMADPYRLTIPKFTVITNSDGDISYFTTNQTDRYISSVQPITDPPIPCMEGQIVKCESTADNNIITASQISENNRFYLPEYQIAENGIFIYNVDANMRDGAIWEKVDNLNIQTRGVRVFKFGYDSYEGRPYVEFPEDYSELINDGLFIYYARTSGINGNISAGTLTQLELPKVGDWADVSAESFSVQNNFSATSGANIETINQAYNNFKKTIGTFETLVTCRDYMNKIYMMTDESTGKYIVSNVLATDIRTDINRAVTICSCGEAGIFYKDTPLLEDQVLEYSENTSASQVINEDEQETPVLATKPVYSTHSASKLENSLPISTSWRLGGDEGFPLYDKADIVENSMRFDIHAEGNTYEGEDGYWHITQEDNDFKSKWPVVKSTVKTITTEQVKTVRKTVEESVPAIDHFDLILYPFKSYSQIKGNGKDIQNIYDASFNYSQQKFDLIELKLNNSDVKTIAHNIKSPRKNDLISINNYLKLNAIISTHSKITAEEGTIVKDNIKVALANAFNMRELDFGEEIPFDSIVEVIENADPRIRVVSMMDPTLYTTFSVLIGYDSDNNPITQEYAVASEWLPESNTDVTGRFDYTNTHTFDSQEAKKIYNKLALRNILAGRLPLFKYNNTFKSNFSDGAYRVTEEGISASELPSILQSKTEFIPTSENPLTVYTVDGVIYTGQYVNGEPTYTKTYVPEQYSNNIITKESNDNNITKIKTSCKIATETESNGIKSISEVTLAAGEVIKFRAPNFITNKTFPAYVNYHFALNSEVKAEADAAKAFTLSELLNKQLGERGVHPDNRRQSVLNYFKAAGHKKTFTLSQEVGKKVDGSDVESKDYAVIEIDNKPTASTYDKPEKILAKSGFVKLVNTEAMLKWSGDSPDGTIGPRGITIPPLDLGDTLFIVDSGVFTSIKQKVDEYLEYLNDNTPEVLPTEADWTISYNFEYVLFNEETLSTWERFIRTNGHSLFGFKPIEDGSTILWHTLTGGHSKGEYVLENTFMLNELLEGDLGYLDTAGLATRLAGVYIAEDLGRNSKPNYIDNNEDYELKEGEYLYIEYTPSTTTEDGATQSQESKTEIYGSGTIIRPNGFAGGLIDSSANTGKSAHKQVKFDTTPAPLPMYSLGASEQIEIRDFAKVALNKNTLANASTIFVYKNFNSCPALENASGDEHGNRSYTLKDGEYIFYTDQNKSEFAYFTAGTEVTLEGEYTKLPKFDIIDLATIFDNGIQEIPWANLSLSNNNGIAFQEFQYITLGAGDTLNKLSLADKSEYRDTDWLGKDWLECTSADYTPAGATKPSSLPKININGQGWEVCSILELNVSPDSEQTLRKTDKVETSIELYKENSSGSIINEDDPIIVAAMDKDHELSFKTNLYCQSGSGELKITDLYTNTDALESFELKVFAKEAPAIIKTATDSLAPYKDPEGTTSSYGILDWQAETVLTINEYGTFWQSVSLEALTPEEEYDKALILPVSTLPNTYGIFSVYINYHNIDTTSLSTWIELLPGASKNDITLFNVDESEVVWDNNKLLLKPGINCIRVNKTSDIFIKTTATGGILYFDNIRLVDCKPVEYLNKDGQTEKKVTQGLNLAQIGYLDASDENTSTFNVYDMRIRKRLKAELTNKALNDLAAIEQEDSKQLTSSLKDVLASRPKLAELVAFIDHAKQEIEKLPRTDADETDLNELFTKYKEVCDDLEQEEALKTALDNNQNIEDLENQLVALLEKFTTTGEPKQELLDKLDAIKIAAVEKLAIFAKDKLSEGDILDDFESVADESNDHLVNDLKLASIKELNTDYSKKLAEVGAMVKEVDDSDIQTSLLTVLDNINAIKHEALIAQIKTLVTTNQESLSASIATAKEYAAGTDEDGDGQVVVNYSALANELTKLIEQLSTASIDEYIDQIESVVNSNMANPDKYTSLALLVSELKLLLDSNNTAITGVYTSLITAVNTILISVQAKLTNNDNAYDSTIHTAVTDLSTEAANSYVNKINSILDNMKDILDDLKNKSANAITKLAESHSEAVASILSNLNSYTEARNAELDRVTSFTAESFDKTTVYSDLPYGGLAVLAVWPNYMKQSFISGVDKLYRDIRATINTPSTTSSLTVDSSFYADDGKTIPRKILVTAADLNAFQSLFNQAKNQVPENIQNSTRIALINELGTLILPSDSVTTAMENLMNEDDTDRNAMLCKLITELQGASTVAEKKPILALLKEELDTAIEIDTQLVNICAKLLCPSILQFEKEFKGDLDDAFYGTLETVISGKKTELLSTTTYYSKLNEILSYLSNAYSTYDALLVALDNDTIAEFTEWDSVLTVAAGTKTLLTTDFIGKLATIKQSLTTQSQIAAAKECKLIKFLTDKNLVAAWQVDDDTWLDSYGNYFISTSGEKWQTSTGDFVEVSVVRDTEGTWKDHTGTELSFNEINAGSTTWYNDQVDIELEADNQINIILSNLLEEVGKLGQTNIPDMDAYSIILLEDALLADIRAIDRNRDFYYNVPVESNIAIDFNEGDSSKNTLMNPAVNYDINNINNNFVISKIDINYLTKGLQIARSSKLN